MFWISLRNEFFLFLFATFCTSFHFSASSTFSLFSLRSPIFPLGDIFISFKTTAFINILNQTLMAVNTSSRVLSLHFLQLSFYENLSRLYSSKLYFNVLYRYAGKFPVVLRTLKIETRLSSLK